MSDNLSRYFMLWLLIKYRDISPQYVQQNIKNTKTTDTRPNKVNSLWDIWQNTKLIHHEMTTKISRMFTMRWQKNIEIIHGKMAEKVSNNSSWDNRKNIDNLPWTVQENSKIIHHETCDKYWEYSRDMHNKVSRYFSIKCLRTYQDDSLWNYLYVKFFILKLHYHPCKSTTTCPYPEPHKSTPYDC